MKYFARVYKVKEIENFTTDQYKVISVKNGGIMEHLPAIHIGSMRVNISDDYIEKRKAEGSDFCYVKFETKNQVCPIACPQEDIMVIFFSELRVFLYNSSPFKRVQLGGH